MPNWKKVIVSGSDAALNSLNVTTSLTASGLIYPTADGTAGQVLTTNGAGILSFSSASVSASYAISASYAATASNALNAQDVLIRVLNQSGNTIAKGIVVHITASNNSSDIPRVITASYENDNNSANTLGITNESIANGAEGFVMTEGVLKGIDTSAFQSGQLIYLGPAGSIIGTAPTAPLHSVRLGQVVRVQSVNGSIYVRIDNGYELGELHDVVDTTTTSSYGDLLVKSGSVWINSKQLTGSYGLTGSLTATSFVGPLQGTASWATNALTASYTPSIAGTDNYIPKFNGSSALENSVMYDDGTNIGVGTTTPGYKLDVNGTFRSTGNSILANATNVIIKNTSNYPVFEGQSASAQIGFARSGTTDITYIGSDASYLFRLWDESFGANYFNILQSGNVGIGTNSPAVVLDVAKTLDNSYIRINSTGNYETGYQIYNGGAIKWQMYVPNSSNDLLFYDGSNNRVTFQYGGNVGIGTTSPGYKLDVNGTLNVAPNVYHSVGGNKIFTGNGSSFNYLYTGTTALTIINNSDTTELIRITDGGNVGIGTTNPSEKLHIRSSAPVIRLEKIGILNWYSGNITGNNYTIYPDSSTSSSFNITSTGNVGIGTTSPSSKFHVLGTSTDNVGLAYFENNHGAGGLYYPAAQFVNSYGNHSYGIVAGFKMGNISGNDRPSILFYNDTAAHSWQIGQVTFGWGTDDAFGIGYRASNDPNSFGGWPSNYFTILTGGNVGIGNDSPSYKLDVSGQQRITLAGFAGIEYHNTAGTWEVYVGTENNTGNARYNSRQGIHSWYANSTATMTLSAAGALRLNSYGSGTFTGTATQKLAVDSSGNVIEIPIGAGPVDGSGTANYITRWVDTDTITTSSIYESSGNIGIGTTSPGSLLQVGSGESTTDALIRLGVSYAGDRTSRGGITWRDGSDTTGKIYTEYDGTMTSMVFGSLYNSGYTTNQTMIIRGNGNVGIGTTTPAYKLSVVGKISVNDGGNSVFVGENAGQSDDATANVNVGVGYNALQNNITGNQNVAVGHKAAATQTAAANNTAVGSNALELNTTGASTTAIGSYALNNNIVGTSNTAVGTAALLFNTSGSRNIAIGSSAGRFNTSGSRNVAIGTAALYENLLGSDNVIIGDNAARYYSTGTSNLTDISGSVLIGRNVRPNGNGEINQIVIGSEIVGLGSNTVVIGNNNIVTTALKGNVGIGLTNPSYKLDISGSVAQIVSSDTSFTAWFIGNTGTGNAQTYYDAINGDFSGADYGFVGQHNAGYMEYYVGPLSPAPYHVFSIGNIGVGTTTPTSLLSGTEKVIEISNSNVASLYLDSTTGRRWSVSSISTGELTFWDLDAVTERMRIDTSGNVGIGTSSPSYKLDVNGTARVTTLIETSALKYKTNIQPLEPQLSKVTQLEPVTFDWLDKPQTKTNIGLIADEVEKIYPEFVSKTEDGEIEGIEYSKLTTVLIQSIKELKEIVDQQQAQINKLLNK